ncbi:MAG: aspartate dehydrogenase domain-containing protein [Candidatus Omnitrophota bacterium]
MDTAEHKRLKIGILGCGAIGSRIAEAVVHELGDAAVVSGLYDQDGERSRALADKLHSPQAVTLTLSELIQRSDCIVEAVNTEQAPDLMRTVIDAGKHLLVMSVGRLLGARDLFDLAAQNGSRLLIPSGAIAGIDAVQAAAQIGIRKLTLTTRKPVSGFKGVTYIEENIDLEKITGEVVLFEGGVEKAVQAFPRNINVAATLALAATPRTPLLIRIITAPGITQNSHEIVAEGEFGRIETRTTNVVCPDNPKTSYLAALSGIQALRNFCSGIRIGT